MVGSAPRRAARRFRAVSASRRAFLFRDVRSLRLVAIRTGARVRLVPARGLRMAAVLPRAVGHTASVWVDVDCSRSVGLADASLWTLGLLLWRLVLDSWHAVGRCLGILGVRAELRELVSAWLEQPACVLLREHQHLWRPAVRPVARMDGCAAAPLRNRLRQRQRRLGPSRRSADRPNLRGPRSSARVAFGLARVRTDSRGWHTHTDGLCRASRLGRTGVLRRRHARRDFIGTSRLPCSRSRAAGPRRRALYGGTSVCDVSTGSRRATGSRGAFADGSSCFAAPVRIACRA
jgi:hypothetical protein